MGMLDNKVVIITGGTGILGKAAAFAFAREGAKLVLSSRALERAEAVAQQCRELGAEAIGAKGDIGDADQCKALADKAVETFGRIDVLVNNAETMPSAGGSGHLAGTPHELEDVPEEAFINSFSTNTMGALRMMKSCLPYLKKTRGTIINFSSMGFSTGQFGFPTYTVDKGAIVGLTLSAARGWGKYGINVNVIEPHAVPNSQTFEEDYPRGDTWEEQAFWRFHFRPALKDEDDCWQWGDPDRDLAPVLVFMASDYSRHITGQIIRADGGSTIFVG